MEEEAATTRGSLLLKQKLDNNDQWSSSDHGGMQLSESLSTTTPIVVLSTLAAVCGSFTFGSAVGYSSPSESGIEDDLGLTSAEYSIFGSILTIGAMLGAVFSGKIADFIGRKGAMGVSETFCILGWLAIVFAKDAWWLDLGRFLVGCGIGILSYVVPVYIAEITPKNVRGSFTSLSQLMIGCGKALTFLIGSLVNWRTLALIGIIPCLAHLLGLFFIPESPRWLAKCGRLEEFEVRLQFLRGENADISQEAADIIEYTENFRWISEDGVLHLFQGKYACSIIVAVGLMAFQEFGGLNGFAFYTSSIFESAGFSSKIGTILAAVVQILMTTLGVLLIDKCGRRPLLMISATGACLGCVLTGFSFFLQDLQRGKELIPILVLIGVLVYLGSFELGMGGIPWIIMSEIFPINIKGLAGSLVTLVSWTGSWVVSYTFNYLFEWSSAGTFFIFAVICGVGILFIGKIVPETKGRTLEEIQSLLNSDSRRFDIEEMGRQVCENRFDIEACCVTMMPSRKKGESLVLSNLKLKVLIEAIRMVLEILYDERFVTFFLWWACLYGTPHRH
ncbi:sugar transporter ERD6-like 5 [Quercus lobata]|uniref:sugar transporter ERD6-like 5 n=1 Tax=Quercus lobata TaxID=97700 RepID=UPI0012482C1F|nr:sugar transporter ERD6-like 5 [Quercus lobata]